MSDSNKDIIFQKWKESAEVIGGVSKYHQPYFSIAVVPDELRKLNENAYIPKVVSIGPRYKGATRSLKQMEQIKWDSLKHLFDRTKTPKTCYWDILLRPILESFLGMDMDVAVRASYADKIQMDRYELVDIMLYDGCFLLEILINGSKEFNEKLKPHSQSSEDRVVRLEESFLTDLVLLENQIPLFILKTLAKKMFPQVFVFDRSDDELVCTKLVHSFLGLSPDSSFDTTVINDHAVHFLELVYASIFENSQVQNNQENHHSDNVVVIKSKIDEEPRGKMNGCATKLQAAGVEVTIKNEPKDEGTKFNPLIGFNFDIEFNNGKLEIPSLHITERGEARRRNFIAWEHKRRKIITKHNPDKRLYKCKCTMAALLFNGLICCASDVQLLKDKKIIVNDSNMSNQDLVDLFSSIPKGVDPSIIDSSYVKMFHDLNTYSATPYVTRIPRILWHNYLTRIPGFLTKGYNFPISIISLLTAIQTIYAILSYHDPKN